MDIFRRRTMLPKMSSLAQLAHAHRAVLVVDAAATKVQAGLIRQGVAPVWASLVNEANSALFQATERVLGSLKIHDIDAFVFCEGPGSTLGIRTTAIALRTWMAVRDTPAVIHAYRSLDLVARDLVRKGRRGPFHVIADARRESWHAVEVSAEGVVSPLRRIAARDLSELRGECYAPTEFKMWAQLPLAVTKCGYDLESIFGSLMNEDCLHPTEAPDVFLHEDPSYKTWTPEIHRAAKPA